MARAESSGIIWRRVRVNNRDPFDALQKRRIERIICVRGFDDYFRDEEALK